MGNGFEQQGRGSGEQENQPAFRRLFDDEDQLMAETSPQFKKIWYEWIRYVVNNQLRLLSM